MPETKKRKYSPTSKAAHDSIKGHKTEVYDKIVKALEKLKVGGTYYEIAKQADMEPVQVARRLSEMGDKVYNVGISRPLPTGRKGLVWQLIGHEIKEGAIPDIEKPPKKKKQQEINNPLFTI